MYEVLGSRGSQSCLLPIMGQKLSEFRSPTKKDMEEKRDNEVQISLERIRFEMGLPEESDEDNDSNDIDATSRLDEHFEHLYSSEGKDKDKERDGEDNGNKSGDPSTSAELDEAHCSNYCPNSAQRHENLKLFGPPDTRKSKSRRKKSQKKETPGREKKKRAHWVLRFNCARLKSGSGSSGGSSEPEVTEPIASCICTGCKRSNDDHHLSAGVLLEARQRRDSTASSDSEPAHHLIDFTNLTNRLRYREDMAVEDCDERARIERAREIAEGMEPPPGYRPRQHIQLVYAPDMICLDSLTVLLHSAALSALSQLDTPNIVHTQVDYIHCLVPDLLQITSCSFYWGKMDRYEAERLLEGKPEGTFLLRDSAQEEYLFSVSFRKYGRSLHARIEQWKHMFSFDSHDPGVYSSPTVCGLIEHYKDPSCCMFFEPTLTYPLHRNFSFPLQHLCRAVICSKISYDGIAQLRLPKALKSYLKEYHYKQRVKVRVFDSE